MGIKDETPEDKIIFDSIDNRMEYSKGIPKEVKTCENCYNKETNPNKYPCSNCLDSADNDLPFWFPAVKFEGKTVFKKDKNQATLDDILKELKLIKYRLDVYFGCDYEEKTEDIE